MPFGAESMQTQASGAGVRIDTRTDEVHWIGTGAVEEAAVVELGRARGMPGRVWGLAAGGVAGAGEVLGADQRTGS